jgi:hypothetical protein
VYDQTSEHDNEMRDILEVIILEHAYRLVPEAGFRGAIEYVDGLAFSLFNVSVLCHGTRKFADVVVPHL